MNPISNARVDISFSFQDRMPLDQSGGSSAQSAANRSVAGQRFIDYGGGSTSQSQLTKNQLNQNQFNRDQFSNSNGLGQQNQFEMQPLGEMIRQILQDLIKMLMGNNQGQPSNSGSDNSKSTSPVGGSSGGGSAPRSQQQSDAAPAMTSPAARTGEAGNNSSRATTSPTTETPAPAAPTSLAAAPSTPSTPSTTSTPSSPSTPSVASTDNKSSSVTASEAPSSVTPSSTVDSSKEVSSAKTSSVSSSTQAVGSTAGMEGFAKVAGTTGGTGGETVTVNSVSELKSALAGDEPRIIKLGSNISAAEKTDLEFGANKTLVGDGKNNQLHNIYLKSGDSASNDIFQNLHFTHDSKYTANGDIPLYIDKGKGYWIDHSTFTGSKGDNYQGGKDKLLYVGGTADMVSLTNSKFENNEYGLILGYPEDTQAAADKYTGYPRMTIAHNDFENLDVRAPGLMRYGQFDVYNNHISDFNLGFTAASNATIFSESNYFENGRNGGGQASLSGMLDDKGNAHFTDVGSNISVQGQTSGATSWRGGDYQRNVSSADEAKTFAMANAGVQEGSLTFAS
ncbi:type III helper protein HopAK1 [Pokkaliibacter plantistimulans]|uniref:Type III helper protein HopAK1 n=1 Tax=Proteobacteria bacterium 228 TaxID=2083153 RepID=A0A2S5KLV7_9PROT|nr:type III helper protein HopAK1 [Pokkaliibacter plantistimulans]PPC75509.1 type III helper protein HopAK1 [Pokkaliibacter plantistimulans]